MTLPTVAPQPKDYPLVAAIPQAQPGSSLNVQINGLQVHLTQGGISHPSDVLLPVRPLGPVEVCGLFAELCRQGAILVRGESPSEAPNDPPTWVPATDWQFQLRQPNPGNGQHPASRIVLP